MIIAYRNHCVLASHLQYVSISIMAMPVLVLLLSALSLGSAPLPPDQISLRTPAPNFRLPDESGKRRTLEEFRGQVVVLNFFATWCRPCIDEMPALDRVNREHADKGVAVLGVAMDERGWPVVSKILAQKRFSYPILLGTPRVAREYGGLKTLPHTVFLDRQGRIVATHSSALNLDQLRKLVETMLAEQP